MHLIGQHKGKSAWYHRVFHIIYAFLLRVLRPHKRTLGNHGDVPESRASSVFLTEVKWEGGLHIGIRFQIIGKIRHDQARSPSKKWDVFRNIRYDFLLILFYHKSRINRSTYEEERIVESVNKIRIGIIGAGNIGGVHIREFSKLADQCEITAITDAYLPLAEAKAQEYGIAHVAATPRSLFKVRNVDAVIIGVPNQYHASLAVQAIEAGKHVLIEKPMGINAAAAKQIYEGEQSIGQDVVMIGHQMRWESVPYADQGAGRSR